MSRVHPACWPSSLTKTSTLKMTCKLFNQIFPCDAYGRYSKVAACLGNRSPAKACPRSGRASAKLSGIKQLRLHSTAG